MPSINVCSKIQCPWYQPETNGFGCQAYAVALHCHLYVRFKEELPYATQYALYGNAPDLTPEKMQKFKLANDGFWRGSERYHQGREFLENHPRLEGNRFPKEIKA